MSSSEQPQYLPYPPSFCEPVTGVETISLHTALHDAEILAATEDRQSRQICLELRLGEPKMTNDAPSQLKLTFHYVLEASLSLNASGLSAMWAESLDRLNGDVEYRDVIDADLLSNEGGHTLRMTSGYFNLTISSRTISWIVDGQSMESGVLIEQCSNQWELWSQRNYGEK